MKNFRRTKSEKADLQVKMKKVSSTASPPQTMFHTEWKMKTKILSEGEEA